MQIINIEVREMTTGLFSIIDAEWRPILNNAWGGVTATLEEAGGIWEFDRSTRSAVFNGLTTKAAIIVIDGLPLMIFQNPFSVGMKGIGQCLLKGASGLSPMEWEVKSIK